METMASRLTALAATHPGEKIATRENLSDIQESRLAQQINKTQNKIGPAGQKKKLSQIPHLI